MKSTKPPGVVRPSPPPNPPAPTSIKCKPHKFALLLADARETIKYQIEMEQLLAEITRKKYDALIKQGFTETQALELCKE